MNVMHIFHVDEHYAITQIAPQNHFKDEYLPLMELCIITTLSFNWISFPTSDNLYAYISKY